jgi:hypothetical protein
MRVSRIFALARTIRCASVGAGVRKRLRDLLGRQAAHFTQRQRHLRVRRQRRMAAREDESQPIILDALVVRPRRGIEHADIGALAHVVQRIEPGAAAKAVDRLEPSR